MSVHSIGVENMFNSILKLAGYEDISSTFDKNYLLGVLDKLNPNRKQQVIAARTAKGKSTKINLLTSKLILDWFYGIDCTINTNGQDLFGFDITTNPEEIQRKLNKLKELEPILKEIGIVKVAVVLIVKGETDYAFISQERQEEIIESLLENVIYELDEQSKFARSYILTI